MKKILIIHPALVVGGAEAVLLNYLQILAKNPAYQVDMVFLENRVNANRDKIPANVNVFFMLDRFQSEFFILSAIAQENRSYWNSWNIALKQEVNQRLLNHINQHSYDAIIDFHRNDTSFYDFLAKYDLNSRIAVVQWIHSSTTAASWREDPQYAKIVMNKYSHFIAICEDMAGDIKNTLAHLSIPNKSVELLYNPLDIALIKEKSLLIEPQDQGYLNDDYILQVARLDERQKNHLGMIEIFYQLKQKGIKEKLYIVGDGGSKPLLEEKIKSLNLENDCLLLGERANPFPLMKNAKLFIHTANFEGLPTVLIESMTCGTPIVAYDCPTGPSEILDNGNYGGLIPMGDKQAFVDKVYQLLNDETQRQTYIDKFPEAVERFSFERIGKQLYELIDGLA
ncbi:glycosyltransferase [Lonepinella sp. BR2271]|uniref:glycosyltransferase n=1 Tax=Lonepinella sp. BR2271 TaxID=3434550 RepID=UPI003F6DC897